LYSKNFRRLKDLKKTNFVLSVALATSLVVPYQALAQTNDSRVSPPAPSSIPMLHEVLPTYIPSPEEGSFTLIGEVPRVFDNTSTNVAISLAVTEGLELIAKRAKLDLNPWVTKGVKAISAYVSGKLGENNKVYVILRQGISWNSYLNYYEYVNSDVYYVDSNWQTVTDVNYIQTGYRVPDDVLRLYGLTPNP
jgi:hypothetical protein